ncbi:NAD(P)-dependent dehydrogenase, short-chain alcohol dehydrogenase family [Chitinophaga terrae (ex Kim and Jung 2007)]|uniref:NAD(P)-dependent dehydrogenase, short-chain alcohol dehydrogenase family n=1 Tax=Chitinophaga terrae (ex Kim and Jung 2007) TaxID=408074 RepID=A0A1H3XX02_9BACT|nr:SDR family oxidoreductase [Chitinophaga terrae (ex Kim and Jung 2007)]GEP89445.1 short-chain dehydrogenase/reductase [Chitinophaga terrae (ex Kim and Jung 2007)]SEA03853.1 NAD(P)-dependent dehydrogenase, short-chain alcohol dehydrogenase family [Chitinophaga terrae (ex Kim and Jung 2007)]
MSSPFSLSGKNILVTGGSSGIGKCIAQTVATQGATVILLGRNKERLQEVVDKLPGKGHNFYAVDLTREEEMNTFVDNVGRLNGVVHSAGLLSLLPIKILDATNMELISKINYIAPVQLTRILINNKKLGANTSVVFITSVNGVFTTVKGFAAYSGTKAALNSISKVFALEYASRQIRFNTVAPGMIKTEMYEEMVKKVGEESVKQDKLKYPLGDYGNPEDVANATVYLLADASKWVTGTSLVVDGGLTIT